MFNRWYSAILAMIPVLPSPATGLPASPGGATGDVVFLADEAVEESRNGYDVILVRRETTPEDIHG
jgi:pyruvate, orthophosphate dikinase